jgi:hypothetical protein
MESKVQLPGSCSRNDSKVSWAIFRNKKKSHDFKRRFWVKRETMPNKTTNVFCREEGRHNLREYLHHYASILVSDYRLAEGLLKIKKKNFET